MQNDLRKWIALVALYEGKVDRHPLRSGGMTVTVVDPTAQQFHHFLPTYDDATARFNMDDAHLVMGDHYHWTHGDLQIFGVSGITGWLAADRVVVWGNIDIGEVSKDDPEAELAEANRATYQKMTSHPVFARLYRSVPKIGFTCNEGLMISFMPDGSYVIEDIDVRLDN